jgi:hypothetical protein
VQQQSLAQKLFLYFVLKCAVVALDEGSSKLGVVKLFSILF